MVSPSGGGEDDLTHESGSVPTEPQDFDKVRALEADSWWANDGRRQHDDARLDERK